MEYLWTEDSGAGFHFWQLLNQYIFNNRFIVESKKDNQKLLDAVEALTFPLENTYYIAFDHIADNTDIMIKYARLQKCAADSGGKIILLDIKSFEYFILAFEKLVTWTGTGKKDKIKIREEILAAIVTYSLKVELIEDKMTLQYLARFNKASMEKVIKSLVSELTQNEKWSVNGQYMGECWFKDCCVSDYPGSVRCGNPSEKLGNEKMLALFHSKALEPILRQLNPCADATMNLFT